MTDDFLLRAGKTARRLRKMTTWIDRRAIVALSRHPTEQRVCACPSRVRACPTYDARSSSASPARARFGKRSVCAKSRSIKRRPRALAVSLVGNLQRAIQPERPRKSSHRGRFVRRGVERIGQLAGGDEQLRQLESLRGSSPGEPIDRI